MDRSGMRDVCSSCASWVEKSWSFCKDCGAARPAKRSPPTASSASSLYNSSCRSTRVTIASKKGDKGKRLLRRRRRSSEDVETQLRQWRVKSETQENLLQQLEHCNAATRQAIVSNAESDLRQIVHDGREFVRTWPGSSKTTRTSKLTLPGTGMSLGRRDVPKSETVKSTAPTAISSCPNGRVRSTSQVESSRYPPNESGVYAAERGDCDELHNLTCRLSSISQFPIVSTGTAHRTPVSPGSDGPPQVGDILQRAREGVQHNNIKRNKSAGAANAAAQPSGWFWGEDRCDPGHGHTDAKNSTDTDRCVAAPGEGAMGAYWRETTSRRKDIPEDGGKVEPRDAVAAATVSAHQRNCFLGVSSADQITTTDEYPHGDDLPPEGNIETSSNVKAKALINVASTKAAVRSASNRLKELSYLLSEGNNPPREECLAKAEAAVRAAQSAISCANERLFQLELAAAPSATLTHTIEEIGSTAARGSAPDDYADGVDVRATIGAPTNHRKRHGRHGTCSTTLSSCCSSLLPHIEQLSKQLELAQSLQAASLAARARLAKRFALEDAAAVRLQALARGKGVRRWERRNEAKSSKITDSEVARAQLPPGLAKGDGHEKKSVVSVCSSSRSSLSQRGNKEHLSSLRRSSSRATSPKVNTLGGTGQEEGRRDGDERSVMTPLPRKEDLWWTLAEAESADEIGESESELLMAIVKLQALVRSRLARSKAFATVNARFVEHFDEEHQHPFYVSSDTNSSQWNRPFGFGFTREEKRSVSSSFLAGGDSKNQDGLALGPTVSDNWLPDEGERSTAFHVCRISRATAAEGTVSETIASIVKEVLAGVIGELGRVLLNAIINLQALVRSRLSRSETIAAVNARFVEHFDDEYQCAFYVCSETNVSQWNRPFGFGFRRGGNNGSPLSLLYGDGVKSPTPDGSFGGEACDFEGDVNTVCAAMVKEGDTEGKLRDTPREEAAAVIIQCAARAVRARGQLAEKILLAGL